MGSEAHLRCATHLSRAFRSSITVDSCCFRSSTSATFRSSDAIFVASASCCADQRRDRAVLFIDLCRLLLHFIQQHRRQFVISHALDLSASSRITSSGYTLSTSSAIRPY